MTNATATPKPGDIVKGLRRPLRGNGISKVSFTGVVDDAEDGLLIVKETSPAAGKIVVVRADWVELVEQPPVSGSVVAEDAPIGVQLWPTRRPQDAPAFTLAEVVVHRNAVRSWVEWVYENGNVRTFELGEKVAVRYS